MNTVYQNASRRVRRDQSERLVAIKRASISLLLFFCRKQGGFQEKQGGD
jgi:hypothetical protein